MTIETDRDLERSLRRSLHDEVTHVELTTPEWTGVRPLEARQPRRVLLAVAALMLVVAGIGSVAFLRTSPRSSADRASMWTPPGVEQPLERVLLDDLVWAPRPFAIGPTRPGSFHVYRAQGREIAVYDSIEPASSGRILEVRCVESRAAVNGCVQPTTDPPRPQLLDSMWTWLGVPNDIAYIAIETPSQATWQRPADGNVLIAVDDYAHAVITAYDKTGIELSRFTVAELVDADIAGTTSDPLRFDTLSPEQDRDVAGTASLAAMKCVTFAELDTDPRSPLRADAATIWDRCVAAADRAAAGRFIELGGRTVDHPHLDAGRAYEPTSAARLCMIDPSVSPSCAQLPELNVGAGGPGVLQYQFGTNDTGVTWWLSAED